MIFKYEVEIEIDEKTIEQKYPNFQLNYSNPKEFADNTAFCWEVEGLEEDEKGLERWGYEVRVKCVEENFLHIRRCLN
ncbi:MAG: hypothetical protein AAB336_02360 [Acidobacteriota bacterium]